MNKKRHHYVPKAYLKSFCDEGGKVHVYRKDAPWKPICQSPDNIGFHKYYYSQPLPEGERDNNSLEDLFSKLEGKWPPLVDRLRQGDDINDPDSLGVLLDFIVLQRTRVPAARDAVEKVLAELVKSTHGLWMRPGSFRQSLRAMRTSLIRSKWQLILISPFLRWKNSWRRPTA